MSKDMGEYERGLFDAVRYELYRCVKAGLEELPDKKGAAEMVELAITRGNIFNHIAHTLDDLTTLLGDDFPKVLEDETTGDDDTGDSGTGDDADAGGGA